MKLTLTWAAIAAAPVVRAQWYHNGPDCAQSCFSSFYTSATDWPSPGVFCSTTSAPAIATCISSACGATPTAFSSFTSLSSSLCDRWSSCSSAGSTGVLTITHTGGPGGPFGPGFFGPGGNVVGPPGAMMTKFCPTSSSCTPYPYSYPTGVYTVTGCPFDGSPWFGGPGGIGGGGPGWGGWGAWGHGWAWTTRTTTYTVTRTGAGGSLITETGVATVAVAVSADATSTVTLTGTAAAQQTPNVAAPQQLGPGGSLGGVKAVGAALGAVVAVVGML